MTNVRFVGRVKNTGRKCVVVFRHIYDENGNVTDKENCLAFETESLPDAEHQNLMQIVEDPATQASTEMFEALNKERHFETGQTYLQWLHQMGRLRRFPTTNIEMTPNSHSTIGLHELNTVIDMQAQGSSMESIEKELERMKSDEESDVVPDDGHLMTDERLAESFLNQAEQFEAQAKELREKAEALTKEEFVEGGSDGDSSEE